MEAEAEQQTLIEAPEFQAMSINYVPDTGEFQMPEDPLIFKGYKLQQFVFKMEKIQESMPGQFNAAAYRKALDDLNEVINQIKERENATIGAGDINERRVGEISTGGNPSEMGEREFPVMDLGIPTPNPFSRQRLHSV